MKSIPFTNLLLITDGLFIGGRERQVLAMVKGFNKRGMVKVFLAVIDHGGEFQAEAQKYAEKTLSVQRHWRYDLGYLFRLLKETKNIPLDCVLAVGWMSSWIALLFSKIRKIPYVDGGIRYAPPKLTWQDKLQRFACTKADRIVANAYACLEAFGLADHPNATVIYNGLDLSRFNSIESHALQQDEYLCMVANFSKYKDHITPLRALKLLENDFPNLKLIYVGKDYGTLSETKRVIEDLRLEERVNLVHNDNEPSKIIAGAAIGILMSNANVHGEGCSNTILEYMALGKPVIANDLGGNKELIENGVNGYLVPFADEKQTAEKIANLLQNPQLTIWMGQNGWQRVQAQFSVERMIEEYHHVIGEITHKGAAKI